MKTKLTDKQKKQLEIYYNVKFAQSLSLILKNYKEKNVDNSIDLLTFLETLIKTINETYCVDKGGGM